MRFGYKHLLISSMVLLSVIFFMSGFAFGAGLTLNIDEKPDSNKIVVSGTTDRSGAIILQVRAPNGNLVSVDQLYTFSDGSYITSFGIGGDLYKQDGMYTISVRQDGYASLYHRSAEVKIVNGHLIPEFGTNPEDEVTGGGVVPVLDQDMNGILTIAIIGAISAGVWYFFWHRNNRKPEPPTNLTATAVAGPRISLEWDDPTETNGSPIISYKLVRAQEDSPALTWDLEKESDQHVIDEIELTIGTTYYYKVHAVNKYGTSDPSNDASAVAGDVPDPPENLQVIETTKQSITIAWDSSPTAETYTLSRGTEKIATTVSDIKYKDPGLQPGVEYTYQVTAINDFGESGPGQIIVTTEKEEVKEEEEVKKKERKFFTSYPLDKWQEEAVQSDYDKPLMIRAGPGSGKTRVVIERIKEIILHQEVDASRILCLSFTKTAETEINNRLKDDVDLKGDLDEIIKERKKNKKEELTAEQEKGMREVLKDKSMPEALTTHKFGWDLQGGWRKTGDVLKTSGQIEWNWKTRKRELDPYYEEFTSGINADDFPEISKEYPNQKGEDSFKQKLKDGVSAWKREGRGRTELAEHIHKLVKKQEDRRGRKDEFDNTDGPDVVKLHEELLKYWEKYEYFLQHAYHTPGQELERKIDFDNMTIGGVKKLEGDETEAKSQQDKFDHIIIDEFQDCNWIQTRLAYLLSPKGHITVVGDEDQSIYGFQGANGVQNFKLFENSFSSFNVKEMKLRINYRSTKNIVKSSASMATKEMEASEKNGNGVSPKLIECETEKDEFLFIKKKISELEEMKIGGEKPLHGRFAVLFRKDKQNEMKKFKDELPSDWTNTKNPNNFNKQIKTIHKAKGSEYPVVFIAHFEEKTFPVSFQGNFQYRDSMGEYLRLPRKETPEELRAEEEKRILYVGMTRAEKQLFLTCHTVNDEKKLITVSRFLSDIEVERENYEKSENEEEE